MHPLVVAICEGIVQQVICDGLDLEVCVLDYTEDNAQVMVSIAQRAGAYRPAAVGFPEIEVDPQRVEEIWAASAFEASGPPESSVSRARVASI